MKKKKVWGWLRKLRKNLCEQRIGVEENEATRRMGPKPLKWWKRKTWKEGLIVDEYNSTYIRLAKDVKLSTSWEATQAFLAF